MKKTNCNGQTCVGDLRLSPPDVGSDLRLHGVRVIVPDDVSSVGLDIDGQTWLIEGSREELIAAIIDAGYTIESGITSSAAR